MAENRKRLAHLVAERSLLTGGFRKSLRALVNEFTPLESEFYDAEWSREDSLRAEFDEWFGSCAVVPAAHRIVRSECDGIYGITVEVYEVEGSKEIDEYKLEAYGRIADGDGPCCELHILDKYDHEIVVTQEMLEPFAFLDITGRYHPEHKREMLKAMRARATVQHHGTIVVDDRKSKDLEREISQLRRSMAKMEYAQIRPAIQNIIYGLGNGTSHKEIARLNGVSGPTVRAISLLMKSRDLDPSSFVKDSHAKWRAAYDAVRELGIQL